MADNWLIKQTIDLANPSTSPAHWLNPLLVTGDNEAHTWQVNVTKNGAPVDLTGAFVTCYIVRPRLENALVVLGSVSGNVLSATFPKEAYYFEGNILAAIKYTDRQGATTTAAMLYAHVKRAIPADVIDPGGEILNLEQMLAMYYAMERGINAVENMQVEATTLPAGAQATAEASYNNDILQILFGIPQGIQGVGGTSTVAEVITGEPGTAATFVDAEDSTPENRRYIVTIPAGHDGIDGEDGKDGKDGNDFVVKGKYTTLEDLMADFPVGEAGDSYFVGTEPPYDVYVWDVNAEEWVNAGAIEGPPGNVPGPQGPSGNLLYPTFVLNFDDGQLYLVSPKDYEGFDWRINPETRELEVGIEMGAAPGQIGENEGVNWKALGAILLNPRGHYDEAESYEPMDVVLYGSNSHVCIKPCTGIAPENDEHWKPMTNVPEEVDLSALAAVARTGSYNDLKDKPSIPSALSELTNDAGYQTAEQVQGAVTEAVADAVGDITGFSAEVAEVLPETGEQGIIYLVENASGENNYYDEYIWIGGNFERIGNTEVDLSGYVPVARTINGKELGADVTLDAQDVNAVPVTRTVNGKALSADVTLGAADVNAVPTTRTINSKALSANIALSAADVGAVATSQIVITTVAPTEGSALAAGTIVYVV